MPSVLCEPGVLPNNGQMMKMFNCNEPIGFEDAM